MRMEICTLTLILSQDANANAKQQAVPQTPRFSAFEGSHPQNTGFCPPEVPRPAAVRVRVRVRVRF
jgi:hypothetical protein